mmetsp:Transcript_45225/g.98411  ORF Transcript_45225/g.98411 Transcript_45225/m.98411 type:complete len:208 (-) Transcript_45225:121-744(-)
MRPTAYGEMFPRTWSLPCSHMTPFHDAHASGRHGTYASREKRLGGEALPSFPVWGVLLGELGQLVLHGHSAAGRLGSLPCLLQALLVVIRVQQTVHGVLGIGEERVLSPSLLRLFGTFRARHQAPESILLEGVKHERAKANHGEDQGGEWHQHCRPLAVVAVLGLGILCQHGQGRQGGRCCHSWIEVNARLRLWQLVWTCQEAASQA